MPDLSDSDLAKIRDSIGPQSPPSDDNLYEYYDDLGRWRLVALRVLRRRRATVAQGGQVDSISIPGAVTVGISVVQALKALDEEIKKLEADDLADQTPVSTAPLTSSTYLCRRQSPWRRRFL